MICPFAAAEREKAKDREIERQNTVRCLPIRFLTVLTTEVHFQLDKIRCSSLSGSFIGAL